MLGRYRSCGAALPCLGGMRRGALNQAAGGDTLRVAPAPSAPQFWAAGLCASNYRTVLQPLHPCRDGRRRQRRAVLPDEGWRPWMRVWLGQDAQGHQAPLIRSSPAGMPVQAAPGAHQGSAGTATSPRGAWCGQPGGRIATMLKLTHPSSAPRAGVEDNVIRVFSFPSRPMMP